MSGAAEAYAFERTWKTLADLALDDLLAMVKPRPYFPTIEDAIEAMDGIERYAADCGNELREALSRYDGYEKEEK